MQVTMREICHTLAVHGHDGSDHVSRENSLLTLDRTSLSRPEERVRFVLVAQITASGLRQDEIAAQSGLSENQITNLVRHDNLLESEAFDRLRLVEGVIGTRAISRYADRIRDLTASSHRDVLADPRWWRDVRERPLDSPIAVVMAGHALLAASTQRITEKDRVERLSRRHLAFGLCRVATGAFGYSLEAITLLGRLAPAIRDEMCEFMSLSPVGGWIARSADRALRLYPSDPGLYRSIAHAVLESPLDTDDPSRVIYPLLLRRRLILDGARHGESEIPRRLVDEFVDLVRNDRAPARWRRFAMWIMAEFSQHRDADGRLLVDKRRVLRLLRDDSLNYALGDVQRVMLDGPAGEFSFWQLPDGDLFLFETKAPGEPFIWCHDSATETWLTDGLARLLDGRNRPHRWRASGSRLMLRIHDTLTEFISHPGLVRLRSAVDMLNTAGPIISAPASATLTDLLRQAVAQPELSPGAVDNVLFGLGALRRPGSSRDATEAARWLSRNATRFSKAEHRASALWSLGDTWAGYAPDAQVLLRLNEGMNDESPSVRRAALHCAAATGSTGIEADVARLADSDPDPRTRRYARWCLAAWDPRSLTLPPSTLA